MRIRPDLNTTPRSPTPQDPRAEEAPHQSIPVRPLRITGGTAKNRKLISPKTGRKAEIRPTSDRVREAVFSILGDRVRNAYVLDIFAGTGSLGIEALSRGAAQAVFVDQSSLCLNLIRRNLELCFPDIPARLLRLDLRNAGNYSQLQDLVSGGKKFQLIFLDPPYEKKLAETALTMVDKTGILAADGTAVAEERWNAALPDRIGSLALRKNRRYGETGIWFYENDPSPAGAGYNPF